VSADEIFVLMLTVICIVLIASVAIRSHRRPAAADAAESDAAPGAVAEAPQVPSDNGRSNRRQRPKR
jgi:hypothetical protein